MEQTNEKNDIAAAKTPDGTARRPFWKRKPVIVVGIALLGWVLSIGLALLGESFTHESTDNAFLDGNVVSIGPKVSGQVRKVFVDQNQFVHAGDPLLEIDPRDYEVQLEQKKSALAAAHANELLVKASFELLKTEVQSAEATAKQSEAEAASDEARADKARADLQRAEDLNRRKIISPQEYDTAKSAAAAAIASWNAGKEKFSSDQAKIAAAKAQLEAGRRGLERAQAQAEESNVDVKQAELNLSYTHVTAPQDGLVTRKAVESGDYIQVGQKLMALVPKDLWVTANFKETQLKKIRVGQKVRISIDAIAKQTFPGIVQSIQAGSGAAFSLLPPENAVGNYVKVVQRVPVRIFFETNVASQYVLGPGMSVVPTIHVASFEISEAVTLGIAIFLALVIGFLWWKKASAKSAPAE
ncbi:MAG TPA: HlyD family secretion protein [Candidatus Paceibacterota bacterium]|nr:HlyD family secretion protein [Candidatus Paceibacterota bacterium]